MTQCKGAAGKTARRRGIHGKAAGTTLTLPETVPASGGLSRVVCQDLIVPVLQGVSPQPGGFAPWDHSPEHSVVFGSGATGRSPGRLTRRADSRPQLSGQRNARTRPIGLTTRRTDRSALRHTIVASTRLP